MEISFKFEIPVEFEFLGVKCPMKYRKGSVIFA